MKVYYQQEPGGIAFYEEGCKDYSHPLCIAYTKQSADILFDAINRPETEIRKLKTENAFMEEVLLVMSAPNEWWPCERYDDFKIYFGCDQQCAPCRIKWAKEWVKGWRPDNRE